MKYWDINKALSYDSTFIFALGQRSLGKTYTTLKYCVKQYIKKGAEMVYIRRYEPELKKVAPYIFDDVASDKELKGYLFRRRGQEYQIAKKPANDEKPEYKTFCHLLIASQYQDYKGIPFPNVNNVVWDEYLRETRRPPGYLPDEVAALLSILVTIARNRTSVRFFLLSNACDLVNPLFRFLNINEEPKDGQTRYKLGNLTKTGDAVTLLMDYIHGADYEAQSLNTLGGAIASDTKYADLITSNTFSNAHDNFIAEKSSISRFTIAVKYRESIFALWSDDSTCIYYINEKVPSDKPIYALTLEDYELNMMAIDKYRPFLQNISRLYKNGALRFSTPRLREDFFKMCKLLKI
jgi:hypothetical protein